MKGHCRLDANIFGSVRCLSILKDDGFDYSSLFDHRSFSLLIIGEDKEALLSTAIDLFEWMSSVDTRRLFCHPVRLHISSLHTSLFPVRVHMREGRIETEKALRDKRGKSCQASSSDKTAEKSKAKMNTLSGDGMIFDARLQRLGTFLAIAFCGFVYVLDTLPGSIEPTMSVGGGWKLGLIATHVFCFVLIPVAMRVFYDGLPELKLDRSAVFASQLGLAFIMVAITAEIGWHVTQTWYYENGFTMLNFMFYFFLLSSFSLWADSLVLEDTWKTRLINISFALGLIGSSYLYTVGADPTVQDTSYKVPIYITLTVIMAVLTYRGYKILDDWRIIFFPVLSVGVNLFFVYLLDTYGESPETNALFHICHDLFGTEAGVLFFTWLVYQRIPKIETRQ